MSTYVVTAKNTTVYNAFNHLLAINGQTVTNDKIVYVGKPKTFIHILPEAEFTREEANQLINEFFNGWYDDEFLPSEGGLPNGPAMCLSLGKCEFVFFGRY